MSNMEDNKTKKVSTNIGEMIRKFKATGKISKSKVKDTKKSNENSRHDGPNS